MGSMEKTISNRGSGETKDSKQRGKNRTVAWASAYAVLSILNVIHQKMGPQADGNDALH